MSEFEPGTVVWFRIAGGVHDGPGIVTSEGGIAWVPQHHEGAFRGVSVCSKTAALDVRPLVVLDLADNPIGDDKYARAVLLSSLRAEKTQTGKWLADQIEQQTKPPKPDEPTGLGAVVEDAGRDVWVKVPLASNESDWFSRDAGNWRGYADIDAVRVLSAGVTP